MPLVRITPALGYAHGHIESLLIQMGLNVPSPRRPDGIVQMEMSEAQIATFQLRGNAHRVERLNGADLQAPSAEAAAAAAPAGSPAPAAVPEVESPFITLACPICGREVNLVRAMMPGGAAELDCSECGGHLIIEHFAIAKAKVRVPTKDEVLKAGYGEEAADRIIAEQTRLAEWVEAGKPVKEFVPQG